MDISVIIPTYNRAYIIEHAIKSVLAQERSDLFSISEIIIIDDGSTDNTESIVRGLNIPIIRYVCLNRNSGPAAARNIGAKEAKSDWIAFQDSDNEWHSDKLLKQIRLHLEFPEFDVIGCGFRVTTSGGRQYEICPEPEDASFERLIYRNVLDTPTLFVRKQAFEEVGGFKEDMRALEDWDLAIRFSKKYVIGFVQEILMESRLMTDGVSSDAYRYYESRCRLIASNYLKLYCDGLLSGVRTKLAQEASDVGLSESIEKLYSIELLRREDPDQHKLVTLKRKLFRKIMNPFTEAVMKGNIPELADNSAYDIDFEGKLPVWVCWFQGEDDMPELVEVCIKSMRRNLPDNTHLILITMDNLGQFISLPPWIADRFEDGSIGYAHLSDIIRMGLLYRYGGMWIDATYYLAHPFSDGALDPATGWYTLKSGIMRWDAEVACGRWSINLMRLPKKHILSAFLLNGLYYYWNVQSEAQDYFMFDYLMDIAYDVIPEVRNMIDGHPVVQPKSLDLMPLLNEEFDIEVFDNLLDSTDVFKLTYKERYYSETSGIETFYGYIKQMESI